MAQVPQQVLPDVAPSAQPTPEERIQAPPGAFAGTVIGQAASDIGEGAAKASENLASYATTLQQVYNHQAANANGMAAGEEMYAAVSKWKEENRLGQAVLTQPQIVAQLNAIGEKHMQGLSLAAQVDYQDVSRRFQLYTNSEVSSYAAEQGHLGIVQGASANADNAARLYALDPDKTGALDNFQQQVGLAAAQAFQGTGLKGDDPQVADWVRGKLSAGFYGQIKGLQDSGDIAGANAALAKFQDSMTLDDYTKLAGGLRVANAANTRFNEAVSILDGPSAATAPVLPKGSAAFAAPLDNATFGGIFDSVFGKGNWTQTSGFRTQAQEDKLRAAGAGTVAPGHISAHEEGTPEAPGARDIVVRGMSQAEAMDKLKAAGYNFELVYDEGKHGPEGEHLHIIPRLVQDQQGGQAAPQAQATGPGLKLGNDPYAYQAAAGERLLDEGRRLHPDDPQAAFDVYRTGMEIVNARVTPLIKQETDNYNNINSYAIQNNVQDYSVLEKKFPTEWAGLSAGHRDALISQTKGLANYPSAIRTQNMLDITNLYANSKANPGALMGVDLANTDLTDNDRQRVAQWKAQVQRGEFGESLTSANHALSIGAVKEGLVQAGFPTTNGGAIDTQSPEAQRFSGMLYDQIESWHSDPGNAGKKLDDKAIIGMASTILGSTRTVQTAPMNVFGVNVPFTGGTTQERAALPSDEEVKQVSDWYTNKYGHAPQDFEIGYWIDQARRHASQRGGQ